MLLKISRWFIYASLITPIIVTRGLFFPFVSAKQIYFRFCVEGALAFFLLYLIETLFSNNEQKIKHALSTLKHHLLHPAILSLAAFAVVMTISSLLSQNPGVSFWSNFERGDGSFQILHYVLFAILIKVLFTNEKSLYHLIITQIIVSIPVSIYAFGQMIADQSGQSYFIAASERVSGTLGNPSYLACYLIFNLAFILYVILKTKDNLLKYALLTLGLLQIFLIFKAQTQGAFVGGVIGLIFFAVHLAVTSKEETLKKIGLWVGVTSVALIMIFLGTRSSAFWKKVPLVNRMADISEAYKNVQPRLWTWGSASSAISEKPLLGWGLENFPYAFDKYYNPLHYGRESFFDRTHNLFLEYFTGGGILAFAAWILALCFYYRAVIKKKSSLWKSVLLSVPIMYLIQGLFLFDVIAIYIAFLLFFVFALNTVEDKEPELHEDHNPKRSALNYTTMTLTAGAMLLLIYTTAWMPLRRNMLITKALQGSGIMIYQITNNLKTSVTPQEAFTAYHDSIDYPSPVGKGEAIQMYEKFVVDVMNIIAQTPKSENDPKTVPQIKAMLADVNSIVDKNPNVTPGMKDRYFNAGINIRAGVAFKIPEAIERGRKMVEADLLLYPNRIELMMLMIELAQATKDKQLLDTWVTRAASLRRDLFVPTTTPAVTK